MFTFLLVIIKKIIESFVNEQNSFKVILFFSVAIPFFSFCFLLMKNKEKKTSKKLQLKIVNYLNGNNYIAHITLFFTFYQLFMLIAKKIH
jgi:hypothetical protein